MAQSGYTPIQLYYSATASAAPSAGNLSNGELALNIVDGKLFYKDNSANVQVIAWKNTPVSTLSGLGTDVGTFLATPTSANLAAAVTDETGTGSLVFATSPSLVTPALSAETFSTSASVSAAGTTQNTATAITSDYVVVTTAASGSGVVLPTATVGRRIVVVNRGANTIYVYPASGAAIDSLGTNVGFGLPSSGVMIFNAATTTLWYSSYNLYTSATVSSGVTSFSGGSTGLTPATATTGAITLSGTLAVTNGGTGVTTSTGTGNVVLSTSPSLTTPSISTSLTFSGTGNRVLADFTNATVTNRTAFQTSTTNSTTGVYALPNGTAVGASWQATNNSDPTNCNKILIATNGSTDVQLISGVNGSNSYLPLSFWNGGFQKMQLSVAGNLGIGLSPTDDSLLEIKAGTTTVAPFKLTSGTNLTSAVAGTIEYDGVNFYGTPTVGTTEQRGVVPTTQQFVLSTAGTVIGPTIGNFFGANSAIQLASSTTYYIEAYCYFLKTTAGTATWSLAFSAATAVAHATLEYTPITGFTTTTITGAMLNAEATANAVTTLSFAATGSLTAGVYHVAKFQGFVTTSAAANLRFNVTQGAGTITPQAGSWYTVRKVATNSGNFVA